MSPRYRALLAAGLAIAAIFPTWPPLLHIWLTSNDYEHSLIAIPLALIWMVRRSAQLDGPARDTLPQALRRTENWLPALLLALALVAWLIAWRANVEIGKQVLAPPILWLAIATAAGWRGSIPLAAPVLYLYVAIPVWEQVVPLLQWMTVAVTHAAFGLGGVPVRIEGILVTIPEGSFIVQEGCSGKRYLIVALATAGLLAAVYQLGWRRTLRYLALTAALALMANWVRVIIVIAAGHLTNMTSYLVAREHFSLGWMIFLVLLAAVWALGRKLQHRGPDPGTPTPARTEEQSRASSPAMATETMDRAFPTGAAGPATAAALLCVPALAVLCAPRWPVSPDLPPAMEIPRVGSDWRGPLPASGQWLPSFTGAASESRAAFQQGTGARVETYWAAYGRQTPEVELIHYSNTFANSHWLTLEWSSSVRAAGDNAVSVRTLLLQTTTGSRWMVDYYYVVAGVRVTQEWEAQALYGALSWIHPAPSAVIAVAAPCHLSCTDAEHALMSFWATSRASDSVALKTLAASRAYTGASPQGGL